MNDSLSHIGLNFLARFDGSLHFRLILQPAMAIGFAIWAGIRDARENKAPFLWALFRNTQHRRKILRQGWADVGKLFMMATIMDFIYQVIVYHWVYVTELLLTAAALSLLPYVLLCGPVNRIVRWFAAKNP